jgi:hypothetical protein
MNTNKSQNGFKLTFSEPVAIVDNNGFEITTRTGETLYVTEVSLPSLNVPGNSYTRADSETPVIQRAYSTSLKMIYHEKGESFLSEQEKTNLAYSLLRAMNLIKFLPEGIKTKLVAPNGDTTPVLPSINEDDIKIYFKPVEELPREVEASLSKQLNEILTGRIPVAETTETNVRFDMAVEGTY